MVVRHITRARRVLGAFYIHLSRCEVEDWAGALRALPPALDQFEEDEAFGRDNLDQLRIIATSIEEMRIGVLCASRQLQDEADEMYRRASDLLQRYGVR